MLTPSNDNIVPIGRRLLVEAYKQAKETDGGLEIVEGDGYATSVFGEVLRAGEECRFKKGDVLMWRRYSLDSLKVYTEEGEKEYFLIEESEVIAMISEIVEPKDPRKQIKDKKDAIKETKSLEEAQELSAEGAS